MNFVSPVTTALVNNICGVQPPEALCKEVKCEVCGILLSSYVVLKDHRAGRQDHHAKIRFGSEMGKEDKTAISQNLLFPSHEKFNCKNFARLLLQRCRIVYYRKHKNQLNNLVRMKKINLNCVICSHLSKNSEEWELHVTSERHVENAKKYRPIVSAEIPPPNQTPLVIPIKPDVQPAPAAPAIPPLLPPQELLELTAKMEKDLNEKALQQIVAKDRKEWKCSHCNVTCQSPCSWQAHLASNKHRKNKHKFHTFPGISKESVKRKYQNSFVRAAETFGNEFIEDGVVFYCKRCDVRMQTKGQLEVHMSSNQHKMNHPIAPVPVQSYNYEPPPGNQPFFNFEQSAYGYGHRNWTGEQHLMQRFVPQMTQQERQQQMEMERERQLVEKAKNDLLARFPYYAIDLQNQQFNQAASMHPESIPMPVEAPQPVAPPENYEFFMN